MIRINFTLRTCLIYFETLGKKASSKAIAFFCSGNKVKGMGKIEKLFLQEEALPTGFLNSNNWQAIMTLFELLTSKIVFTIRFILLKLIIYIWVWVYAQWKEKDRLQESFMW